jgi:GAF domain-containing protein
MRLGTGISGWVIANGRSIANADAALDFETRSALPSVIKCAAVPVVIEGEPVAALTCYTQSTRGFGDRDVAVMEKIAATFATEPLQTLLRGAVVRTTQPYSMRSVH